MEQNKDLTASPLICGTCDREIQSTTDAFYNFSTNGPSEIKGVGPFHWLCLEQWRAVRELNGEASDPPKSSPPKK